MGNVEKGVGFLQQRWVCRCRPDGSVCARNRSAIGADAGVVQCDRRPGGQDEHFGPQRRRLHLLALQLQRLRRSTAARFKRGRGYGGLPLRNRRCCFSAHAEGVRRQKRHRGEAKTTAEQTSHLTIVSQCEILQQNFQETVVAPLRNSVCFLSLQAHLDARLSITTR